MNETSTPDSHPFGIVNLWSQGDGITRSIAIILLIMSIASWVIILSRAWGLWKIKPLSQELPKFWRASSWQSAIDQLSLRESNPFFAIANRANEVITERASSSGAQPIQHEVSQEDWLARSLKSELESSIVRLQRGLAFLASTGATAPFIGLFGTVWGIYHALMSIGASGSASIDQVAGPIGEALIMTGLGLAVAIPAVLGYNAISKENRELVGHLRRFADDLHTYLTQKRS